MTAVAIIPRGHQPRACKLVFHREQVNIRSVAITTTDAGKLSCHPASPWASPRLQAGGLSRGRGFDRRGHHTPGAPTSCARVAILATYSELASLQIAGGRRCWAAWRTRPVWAVRCPAAQLGSHRRFLERQPCTKSSRKVRKNRRVFIGQPGMTRWGERS